MEAILFVSGFLGLVMHWFKRWARKQCDVGFSVYMANHRKSSFASVTSVIAAIAGMLVVSIDVSVNLQTISTAFLAGYAVDSAVNK